MNPARPAKTLADYLVIAASPALIMVMVHSLCFFLVEIFYQGEGIGGVRWVLFWFVLAAVLIARIGVEQGPGHALGYGLVLAFATWCYLAMAQANPVFGAVLLALVWFTAHKLTDNCTLIDETADASGQGLLQSRWRLPQWFQKSPAPAAQKNPPPLPAHKTVSPKKIKPPASSPPPGIWLIYFSLAALPVFGLGQTLLPVGNLAMRHQGFIYLFCYLTAALGLLVTTSFLGLRRYLRQRHLVMPGNIALGWVQFGAVAAIIVLCLALLLPRPGAGDAWGTLRYQVDHQLRRASEYAARFNPHGTGAGREGNQAPPNASPDAQTKGSDQQSGSGQDGRQGSADHGDKSSASDGERGGPSQSGQNPGQPVPELSAAASSFYSWLKMLFWLITIMVVAALLFRHRAVILAAVRSAWAAILNFIAKFLGLIQPKPQRKTASKKTERIPFKLFKNPFITGSDRIWPPEQMIIYSYDALQSWVQEQEAAHGSPKTPREFCRQLGAEMPAAAGALEHLAFLYNHVAYGSSVPGNYDPEQLRPIWNYLSRPRPARALPKALGKTPAAVDAGLQQST